MCRLSHCMPRHGTSSLFHPPAVPRVFPLDGFTNQLRKTCIRAELNAAAASCLLHPSFHFLLFSLPPLAAHAMDVASPSCWTPFVAGFHSCAIRQSSCIMSSLYMPLEMARFLAPSPLHSPRVPWVSLVRPNGFAEVPPSLAGQPVPVVPLVQ